MKLYKVIRPFAVRANSEHVDYWLRLKEGAKFLFYDDSPIPCYQQTAFERVWPENMVVFLDRLEELPYEHIEGQNILKIVNSFNYKEQLSKRILLSRTSTEVNENINKQAEEFNNRDYEKAFD